MSTLVAEESLSQLQNAFVEAIFCDDAAIPATVRTASGPAHASRFGVYRNNVIAGLINAVAARYPVVRKLLCGNTFTQIAGLYVKAEPPRSPVLLEYGDSFPQFLRTIGQGPASDYLADIAALEAARTRAYHAADATPLPHVAFGTLTPDDLPDLRLGLHPSVQLLKSRFPVVSIWEANLAAHENCLPFWRPECALIARPRDQVGVWRLKASAFEFFAALAEEQTVAAAVTRATALGSDFELAACLVTLIESDIVISMESNPAP